MALSPRCSECGAFAKGIVKVANRRELRGMPAPNATAASGGRPASGMSHRQVGRSMLVARQWTSFASVRLSSTFNVLLKGSIGPQQQKPIQTAHCPQQEPSRDQCSCTQPLPGNQFTSPVCSCTSLSAVMDGCVATEAVVAADAPSFGAPPEVQGAGGSATGASESGEYASRCRPGDAQPGGMRKASS
jgi:hypothetical protein